LNPHIRLFKSSKLLEQCIEQNTVQPFLNVASPTSTELFPMDGGILVLSSLDDFAFMSTLLVDQLPKWKFYTSNEYKLEVKSCGKNSHEKVEVHPLLAEKPQRNAINHLVQALLKVQYHHRETHRFTVLVASPLSSSVDSKILEQLKKALEKCGGSCFVVSNRDETLKLFASISKFQMDASRVKGEKVDE